MEVHHHAHHDKKNWKSYFWEFLMLFLAVTLGFFVENQREHLVEHRREKEYMISMLEDLSADTMTLLVWSLEHGGNIPRSRTFCENILWEHGDHGGNILSQSSRSNDWQPLG